MSTPIQIIHIYYEGKYLSLLDSDNHTPLYRVKVCRNTPQVEMLRLQTPNDTAGDGDRKQYDGGDDRLCTASFKLTSFDVRLSIGPHKNVLLHRRSLMSTGYHFDSPYLSSGDGLVNLHWESDGALTGDYKLVDRTQKTIARFRNRLFSTEEVGTFEVVGELPLSLKDEVVISGLAMLVMVQSLNLAAMVIVGSSP